MPSDHDPPARASIRSVLATVSVVISVLVGLGLVLVAATLGRCDAFGGRCPAERPPLYDDDVFGMASVGAALVLAPLGLRARRLRPVPLIGAVVAGALFVGLLVRAGV